MCQKMTVHQRLNFLDEFRLLHSSQPPSKSKLISIKIPEDLLRSFRIKSNLFNTPYQTQIKKLMKDWLLKN